MGPSFFIFGLRAQTSSFKEVCRSILRYSILLHCLKTKRSVCAGENLGDPPWLDMDLVTLVG